MGPTPPGTGVMYAAFSLHPSKSTSPQSFPSTRFMPTSTTIAPSFIISAVTNFALPTAATTTSARATTSLRFFVCEWQTVTVAFSLSISIAIGLPTMLDRPTTTACSPCTLIFSAANIFITPNGVQEMNCGLPCANKPTFSAWKPSTSLFMEIAAKILFSLICGGSGSCTKIPWIFGSAFNSLILFNNTSSEIFASKVIFSEWIPTLSQAKTLFFT